MNNTKYQLCDFTDEEYAALGKAVRTFGMIEHELARTLIDVFGGPKIAQNSEMKKSLRSAYKGRLEELVKALKNQPHPVVDLNWIDDFESKLSQGGRLCMGFVVFLRRRFI